MKTLKKLHEIEQAEARHDQASIRFMSSLKALDESYRRQAFKEAVCLWIMGVVFGAGATMLYFLNK